MSSNDSNGQKKQLTVQNVCKALKYAYEHNNDRTKRNALNFFYAHSHLLPESRELMKGFIKLPRECVLEVLVTNKMNLSQEAIYTAVIQWSECQCAQQSKDPTPENKRAILGDILKKIKYTNMSVEFFNNQVAAQRVLNVDDIIKVYQHLVAHRTPASQSNTVIIPASSDSDDSDVEWAVPPENSTTSHPLGPPVNATTGTLSDTTDINDSRTVPLPYWFKVPRDKYILYRFHTTLAGKSYPQKCPDSVTFSVSKNISLHGIYLYASHQNPVQFKFDFKILENGQREAFSVIDQSVLTNGESRVFLLDINPPLDIRAGRKYDMVLNLDIQGTTYYGVEGLPELQENGVKFKFLPNNHGLNGTNHKVGQFPFFLYLPES
ncbi:BTB/POZ domain-containing protein 6-A-like [Saccostrea echinata]|uniref:BTB/POZ domain-containing protein 6-A-like n=1 Tax=Saccostrea echinata TaxID=191078 RepID=UPI002A815772|nr:BTB/POZ domain-containing protein 6-A-like [Saccostrea echinata]